VVGSVDKTEGVQRIGGGTGLEIILKNSSRANTSVVWCVVVEVVVVGMSGDSSEFGSITAT